MPYGTPVSSPQGAAYVISLTMADNSEASLFIEIRDSGGSPHQAATEDAVQEIVDLLNGSASFVNVTAGRNYPTSQDITPTP